MNSLKIIDCALVMALNSLLSRRPKIYTKDVSVKTNFVQLLKQEELVNKHGRRVIRLSIELVQYVYK